MKTRGELARGVALHRRQDVSVGVHRGADRLKRNRPRSPAADPRAPGGKRQPLLVDEDVVEDWPDQRHSVNRYFSSVQTATTPSFQVIFLPSVVPAAVIRDRHFVHAVAGA